MSQKLAAKKHPYHLNYIRVVGLRQRGGGRVYLRFLPPKPVAPQAKPPPIGNEELKASGILKHVKEGNASVVHADGAHAYPVMIQRTLKKVKTRAVSHKDMEFVRGVRSIKLKGGRSATKTGTQSIDSLWGGGRSHMSRINSRYHRSLNERMREHQWRHWTLGKDRWAEAGNVLKWADKQGPMKRPTNKEAAAEVHHKASSAPKRKPPRSRKSAIAVKGKLTSSNKKTIASKGKHAHSRR